MTPTGLIIRTGVTPNDTYWINYANIVMTLTGLFFLPTKTCIYLSLRLVAPNYDVLT